MVSFSRVYPLLKHFLATRAPTLQRTGYRHGDWADKPKLPLIGGHEGCGEPRFFLSSSWHFPEDGNADAQSDRSAGHVVAIGKGTKTKLKIGDTVGIKWLATACLDYCEDCLSGNEGLCAEQKASGYDVDGTFQQYAVSDARYVTPIPEGLALEIAAPRECFLRLFRFQPPVTLTGAPTQYSAPVSQPGERSKRQVQTAPSVTRSVSLTRVLSHPQTNTKPGNTVVISGASGGLGHLGTQYALAIGLRVVAIDSGEEKRKMLEGYGVKDFIDFKDFADEQALIEEVRRVSGGRGPHVSRALKSERAWKRCPKFTTFRTQASVVFSAGAAAYNHALKYLRPRGTLVCVGLPAVRYAIDLRTRQLR